MMSLDLSQEQKVELTAAVLRVLAEWELPDSASIRLLGLPDDTKPRMLKRHRMGTPLPDEPEIYQRIALLMEIDNALSKLFPHSPASGGLWVTTPRRNFGGARPVDVMLTDGLAGMRRLVDVLNCREGL